MLHGLRTPNEAFFIETPNFWAWAGNLGRYILGHLGYFLANLSAPILVLFSINQPLCLQKTKPLSKYQIIWDWDLNLGHKELGI
jgi:hypothetical protein